MLFVFPFFLFFQRTQKLFAVTISICLNSQKSDYEMSSKFEINRFAEIWLIQEAKFGNYP